MNPLKVLKDVIPALSKVLESIHAHLELILDENKKTNKHLELMSERLADVVDKLNDKKGKE